MPLAIAALVGGLALSALASAVLSRRLSQLGALLGLSGGLLGLLTAVGADSPEISSAVLALVQGRKDLGVGVIFGSNLFNFAALLGVTALTTGRIGIDRDKLLLNGGLACWVLGWAAAEVLGWTPAWLALAVAGCSLVVFIAIGLVGAARLHDWLPTGLGAWLVKALGNEGEDAPSDGSKASTMDMLAIVPLLTAVVAGSLALVRSASFIGGRLGVPELVTGAFAIAGLTGIPNFIAAIRLGMAGRGTAVVSETLNSNSLNLIAGVLLPALVLGWSAPSPHALMVLAWLVGMTLAAVAIAFAGRGVGRFGGALLGGLYLAFTLAFFLV